MGYRKSYSTSDLTDSITSAVSLADAQTQLNALLASHVTAGDLVIYTETFQSLDVAGNNLWVGKVYYRSSGIV